MMYYNLNFDNLLIIKDLRRLINQVWKLLPMREKNEDWKKQLDNVLIELRGLHIMFGDQLDFLILLSKLEGLYEAKNFMTYRMVIFSVISSLTDMTNVIDARKS